MAPSSSEFTGGGDKCLHQYQFAHDSYLSLNYKITTGSGRVQGISHVIKGYNTMEFSTGEKEWTRFVNNIL